MSFLVELEEAIDGVWPVVQTDGVDWKNGEITIRVYPEGCRNHEAIHVTSGWRTKTSTFIKRLRTGLKRFSLDSKRRASRATQIRKAAEAGLSSAIEHEKKVIESVKTVSMLVPSPLEELAQQGE